MAGRGAQTFQKRQKEMQRKEKAAEKLAKRLERKNSPGTTEEDDLDTLTPPIDGAQADTAPIDEVA